MRRLLFAVLLLHVLIGSAQTDTPAQTVYKSAKDSVFLVYLNDSSGTPSALGSAFIVAPHLLVTNAHVAQAGTPVLAVGPVRVPLKVVKVDQQNDLAILSVDINLVSQSLPLGSGEPSPGEQIFAIGNPEGLENTISQGIVSGLRRTGDRDLLQITSPISHGSSGGPILNGKGEVIGVAVGMIEGGQNLNFAVPVKFVRTLLATNSPVAVTTINCSQDLNRLRNLTEKINQEPYANDPSSQYQQDTKESIRLSASLVDGCSQSEVLSGLACIGTTRFDLGESALKAARKLVQIKPSIESRVTLAYELYNSAENEGINAAFAKKDSPDETRATQAHTTLMTEAEHEADSITKTGKGYPLQVADFVLAETKEDKRDWSGAMALHSLVANAAPTICDNDLGLASYRALIYEANNIGRPEQTEQWFRRYAAKYKPEPYEWDAEGDRRHAANDFEVAATAYEQAFGGDKDYGYDSCYASADRYFQPKTDEDAVLTDGRKCVEYSVTETRDSAKKYYESELPIVYRVMADVLKRRGVYQQALAYIKESLVMKPDEPFALSVEADIFEDNQQYDQCVAAAQAAIRNSDGKYPFMHFRLGSCFFSTENWEKAANSFRIAAEGDKSDAPAAFNLGLCLQHQGYTADAQQWFRESLKRNPDDELRGKIMSALR